MAIKVLLVGSSKIKREQIRIHRLLKEKGIPCAAIGITERWSSHKGQLVERLKAATHIVLFLEEGMDWFPFLEGFSAARLPQGVAFLPAGPCETKKLTVLPLFKDPERLAIYLEEEKGRLEEEQRFYEAREFIVASGVGLSEENFALCVQQGKIDFVERFLTLRYSPDTVNSKEVPLLTLAIRNKHRDLALRLIQAKANLDKISGDRGSSALMEASVLGDEELVQNLLEYGADPDLRSKNGQTALMLAIGEGKKAIAKMLILRGADLRPVDALGMTAKKYAALFKQEEIVKLMDSFS